MKDAWISWATELQSLAQAGLTSGKDIYDRERYTRIRDIAAEMLTQVSDLPLSKVKDLFCCETGYQTPKLDTRAAIFQDGKILLVRENDGRWALPGGWCDVNQSVRENTLKEVQEEAAPSGQSESSPCRTAQNTTCPLTLTACVNFLWNVPLWVVPSSPTAKQQKAAISPGKNCLRWQKRKTTASRSSCVLKPPAILTGSPALTEYYLKIKKEQTFVCSFFDCN